ncbi:condensation domain-containing protein [Micromonospora sp. RP3T]|uniref:condensation domain-containing protein n=1 Tax=Micromonospora sp. RP3T TaxID=2135446 RepID=UPI000D177261|nr:condensation domain-containing protein [Micromonospora sp. RP3T]PTA47740.1 condensation protein [Micromonospora sp. RP3T]
MMTTDVAPLSLNQKFNSLFDAGGDDGPFGCRNHVVVGWRVTGKRPIDVDALREALLDVVRRHEALRTRIGGPDDDRHQEILPPSPVRLDVLDLPDVAVASRADRAETLIHEVEAGTIGTQEAPFLRAVLARFDSQDSVLVLMAHHLSVDGQSMALIVRDLAHYYAARTGHEGADLPVAPQYREYGVWEHEAAASAKAREFWRRRLDGARFTAIPTDMPRSAGLPVSTARHRFLIPGDAMAALDRVARSNRATRFMAIAAAYQLLLQRLTGATDVVMATFTPGRGDGQFDETVGTLYNFVPLRTDLTGCTSYLDVLQRVRRSCLEAFSHDIPAMQIFAEAPQLMETVMTDNATAMVFESVPTDSVADAPGDLKFVRITRLLRSQELASAIPDGALWDINIDPSGDGIGAIAYKRNLFREDTIVSMAEEFGRIVRDVRRA